MPWKTVWEDAPKDMSLRLWQESELPTGTQVQTDFLIRVREAALILPDSWRMWYECRHCKGWIEGSPNAFSVNTMGLHTLSGRTGTEYHCIRCGEQIAFLGMMS